MIVEQIDVDDDDRLVVAFVMLVAGFGPDEQSPGRREEYHGEVYLRSDVQRPIACCGHAHRSQGAATRCATRLLRRVNNDRRSTRG